MTMTTIVLVALCCYRCTLLVTSDRITRAPRRRIRRWLRDRPRYNGHDLFSIQRADEIRCSCGWYAAHARSPYGQDPPVVGTQISGEVPPGTDMSNPVLDLETVFQAHREQHRSESKALYLLECPWCVSFWLAWPLAAIAHPHWGWEFVYLVLASSAVTGLLAHIAAPDDLDPED